MQLFHKLLYYNKIIYLNIISNGATKIWSGILSVISIPIIIKYIGVESYGFVSFYSSLEAAFVFLDLGLSATVNREIAKNVSTSEGYLGNKNILRTFEVIYWFIGLFIAFLIGSSSEWIAINWINYQNLTENQVISAVVSMAILFAFRWPISLYTGVFRGIQKLYLLNLITLVMVTFKIIGSIFVLKYLSTDIIYYIMWLILSSAIELIILVIIAWKELENKSIAKPKIELKILLDVWRYALSFNVISIFGTMLSNMDRLIASKYLNLEEIGYYAIALTPAGMLTIISYSVTTAMFPRFTAFVEKNELKNIRRDYHFSIRIVNYLGFGISYMLIFFPSEILKIWTNNPTIVEQSARLLIFLTLAFLFNLILNPAYTLLIASGNTRIPLFVNAINIIIFIPALLYLIPKFGMITAAICLLFENIIAAIVYIIISHKNVLKEAILFSIMTDLLPYASIGLIIFTIGKMVNRSAQNNIMTLIIIIITIISYYLILATDIIKVLKTLLPDSND